MLTRRQPRLRLTAAVLAATTATVLTGTPALATPSESPASLRSTTASTSVLRNTAASTSMLRNTAASTSVQGDHSSPASARANKAAATYSAYSAAARANEAATHAKAPVAAHGGLALPFPLRGDLVRDQEWQLKTLDVASAWEYSSGAGVTVAVIDSGVDATHVDLQGQVLPGVDLVDTKGDGDTDLVGHGTTVAAIIAGKDDTAGVIGIAPYAKILPVRVLDQENRYDDAMIVAKGVRWAVDHGAQVINLSLGGSGNSPALAAALDYAFAKDVVVVACTGNVSASESTGVWYPAREPGVIAVAGMERSGDVLWSGSITGPETVLTAPATQLVGARPAGYWRVQGTSFAAPMVSATAALIRSRWPTMSAGNVINRMIRTAKDLGAPGRDKVYGYGMVNPTAALTAKVPPVAGNPLDTTPDPGVAKLGSAPSAGQGPTANGPFRPRGLHNARVSGANAGQPVPEPTPTSRHGWLIAGSLFLLSLALGLLAARRFIRFR